MDKTENKNKDLVDENSVLKKTLKDAYSVISAMSTFYRHSPTWKTMRGSEVLENIEKVLNET